MATEKKNERNNMRQCEECKSWVPHRTLINKQIAGKYDTRWVCDECLKKHERELELTRQNFQAQFGEKPVQEQVKTESDTTSAAYTPEFVDIHKIIDDAMEKKDRSITIFIGEAGTSVYVNPYEDKPREWILRTGNAVYPWVCPECGDIFKESSRHCPSCGEELRKPINY